ncbi:MAG: membrane lipoprotein lipid attachment site-containing protein [Rhodanobacteraceae bacterium]
MRKYIVIATAIALLAGCSSSNAPQQTSAPITGATSTAPASSDTKPAVRKIVERFGQQMQKISTLAPPDAVRRELPQVYGDVLSPELLATWRAHPDQAIGREGSSPWPQKIEIDKIDCANGESCRVTGEVDYVTSNEIEHGGVFMRRGVTLEVTHSGQHWRIASVQLAPAKR